MKVESHSAVILYISTPEIPLAQSKCLVGPACCVRMVNLKLRQWPSRLDQCFKHKCELFNASLSFLMMGELSQGIESKLTKSRLTKKEETRKKEWSAIGDCAIITSAALWVGSAVWSAGHRQDIYTGVSHINHVSWLNEQTPPAFWLRQNPPFHVGHFYDSRHEQRGGRSGGSH